MLNRLKYFRIIGIAEGVSFIVLLAVAMPLKYYMDMPLMVKYVGWAHGILFVAYVAAVFASIEILRWNWFRVLTALGASLVPFGTFILDKELKRRQQEMAMQD